MNYIKLRQCKLEELRRAATVSRPDIRARLAPIASRINRLRGSDVYRINGLVRVRKDWQRATELKYASSSKPWKALGWGDGVHRDLWNRGDRVLRCSRTLAGWSDAAYGDQLATGRCRLGYVVGLMSSTLKGPCRILQRASTFARNMEKSNLGGRVYAPSEMMDHVLLLKEFFGPFEGMRPGAAGLGG